MHISFQIFFVVIRFTVLVVQYVLFNMSKFGARNDFFSSVLFLQLEGCIPVVFHVKTRTKARIRRKRETILQQR